MKKTNILLTALAILTVLPTFAQTSEKLISEKTQIKFYSHTAVEDIQANNNASVSTINKTSGDVIFSVPMQGFEFEKALMQKHFNSDKFLDTQKFPKAKLKGKIVNLDQIDFKKDGVYNAVVEGELTIKDISKPVREVGTVTVKGSNIEVNSKFNVTLADYGISFADGKPSTNIAREVEVTVKADYKSE